MKFAQNPDGCMKEFVTEPRKFFELLSDDAYDVSDVHIMNDCLYVMYKKSKEFQTPARNTNVIIASYVTTHARLELYSDLYSDCIVTPPRSYTDTWRVSTALL